MEPVPCGDDLPQQTTTQDVLADKRHEDGVLDVVIESAAPADPFDQKASDAADSLGVARLTAAKGTVVGLYEVFAKGIGQDFGRLNIPAY